MPLELRETSPDPVNPLMTAVSPGPGTLPPTQLAPTFQSPPVGAADVLQVIVESTRRGSSVSRKRRLRLRSRPEAVRGDFASRPTIFSSRKTGSQRCFSWSFPEQAGDVSFSLAVEPFERGGKHGAKTDIEPRLIEQPEDVFAVALVAQADNAGATARECQRTARS